MTDKNSIELIPPIAKITELVTTYKLYKNSIVTKDKLTVDCVFCGSTKKLIICTAISVLYSDFTFMICEDCTKLFKSEYPEYWEA